MPHVLGAGLLVLLTLASGCNRPAVSAGDSAAAASEQQQLKEQTRRELEIVPPPSKTQYMAVRSLDSWENPYVTVQESMVTLHVLLADPNPSQLGQGGLLRPRGARRQDLNVRVRELPAALNAVPRSAWPYGRVLAVEEAHGVPGKARPEVRRNMEAVMKTLGDVGVVIYEWSEGGGIGLR